MKRNFVSFALIALVILAMLVFWGCSESTDPVPPENGPTEEQLQQLEDIRHSQLEYYTELENFLAVMDTTTAKDSLVTILVTDAAVEWARVTSQGINIQWEDGFRGTLLLDPMRGSGNGAYGNAVSHNFLRDSAAISSVGPKSKSTLYLAPFYHEFAYWDDAVIDSANAVLGQAGYDNFEVYKDVECGFGWFNTTGLLDDYGIIRISSHGTAWPSTVDIQRVYLWTGETANRTTDTQIYDHLKDGLAIMGTYRGSTYYTIEGGLFAAANNFTDNSPFVSLGFCYSALGNWPAHVVNCGASAVTAYSWAILASIDTDWTVDFFEEMCDTSRATPLTIGEWDSSEDRLYYDAQGNVVALLYSGDDDMTLWEVLRITSIDPTSGAEGTIVTIRGVGFGDTAAEVWFGDDVATNISAWSDTQITVAVPAGITEGSVVLVKVLVDGRESNGVEFTISSGSQLDMSGLNSVRIKVMGILASWEYHDGSTGDSEFDMELGYIDGSFAENIFHGFVETTETVDGYEGVRTEEATVIIDLVAQKVTGFEYTKTWTRSNGSMIWHQELAGTSTHIPISVYIPGSLAVFDLTSAELCSQVTTCQDRLEYPLDSWWREISSYSCDEGSRIHISFSE